MLLKRMLGKCYINTKFNLLIIFQITLNNIKAQIVDPYYTYLNTMASNGYGISGNKI